MRALPGALAWISALLAVGSAGCIDNDDSFCPQVPRAAQRTCTPRPGAEATTGEPTGGSASDVTSSSEGTATGPMTGTTGGTATGGESTGTTGSTTSAGTGAATETEGAGAACGAWDGRGEVVGGPYVEGDLCCWDIDYGVPSDADTSGDSATTACGRPFLVGGDRRVAGIVAGEAWRGPVRPNCEGLDADLRAALAEAWLADAAAEHASIAAFARFTGQLLGLGAPAELVAGAVQAGADEVEHARLCFGLASAYAGEGLSAGPLSLAGGLAGEVEITAVIVGTFVEGCVGETIAAVVAAVAAEQTIDPGVREVWRRIAADEGRHAALAWQFVAWALPRAREGANSRLPRVLGELLARTVAAGTVEAPGLPGRLSPGEQARVERAVLREVVAPRLRWLLRGQARGHEAEAVC